MRHCAASREQKHVIAAPAAGDYDDAGIALFLEYVNAIARSTVEGSVGSLTTTVAVLRGSGKNGKDLGFVTEYSEGATDLLSVLPRDAGSFKTMAGRLGKCL